MFSPVVWGIAASLVSPGVKDVSSTPFVYWACQYAAHRGFRITATTNGAHNTGSKHGRGLAIDLSVRGRSDAAIDALIRGTAAWGWRVLDERRRLPGERVWSGPHLHVEARGRTWTKAHSPAAGLPARLPGAAGRAR